MDNLYAQLIEQVKTLAEDFFAEVSVDSEGKGRHVSIFIQVRRSSENSWAILWARNTAAPGKPVALRVLNKGTGASYPVGTFSTVKEPLRGLCRAYERQLDSIRAACYRNRELRRAALAHARQIERLLDAP